MGEIQTPMHDRGPERGEKGIRHSRGVKAGTLFVKNTWFWNVPTRGEAAVEKPVTKPRAGRGHLIKNSRKGGKKPYTLTIWTSEQRLQITYWGGQGKY